MLKSLFLWSSFCFLGCVAHVAFTNLKCNFKNVSIGVYEQCEIKAVNRTHKYISMYGKLFIKPIDNIMVNFKFMRFDHGYKPFFVDMSFDACKYLRNRKNPIVNLFYNPFKNASNVNHTCPYNHDIIIDKFYTGEHEAGLAKLLPIPNGLYAVFIKMYIFKMELCDVNVYLKITN